MGLLVSHLHPQAAALGCNRHALVPQLPRQVEGLAQRLLQRELLRVQLHRGLDRRPHLRRRAEESVCRDESRNSLVRPAEVVAVDEEGQPPHAVVEVGEDGPREELVPQRLPEALHLPQRLRVVRAALDVPNPLPLQLRLEGRLSPPRRVLPPVVGQRFLGHAECGNPALESFQHELCLLLVGDGVADDEAAVVVHEDGDVEPLVPPQQEGEDVRLPQLIRRGPLEARLRPRRLLDFRRPRLQQALVVQNPPHRRF